MGRREAKLDAHVQSVATRDAAAYALPYKVHEDSRKTILCYLVHLTNSDLGMRVMKEKMIKKSGEITFFPITLRPTEQLGLDVAEQAVSNAAAVSEPDLQRQSMSFVDLLNTDYPLGHNWVENQYSKALQAMERVEPPTVTTSRFNPVTAKGKPKRAIEHFDQISFVGTASLL